MFNKPHSSMSHSAVDCRFNVNKSIMFIKFMSANGTLIKQNCLLVGRSAVVRGSQGQNPVFPIETIIQHSLSVCGSIIEHNYHK